jgi:hypothetical protein
MTGKSENHAFIRWQGRTIEQLGYSLNLFLGLAVAALGYEMSLLLKMNQSMTLPGSLLLTNSSILLSF